ncbi:MAG TPA: hypothetical protein PKB10_10930 [Tepidisphaeraceae bacterium]|nr:hypothetical protein [Tepidisphaeraceae bacterium]
MVMPPKSQSCNTLPDLQLSHALTSAQHDFSAQHALPSAQHLAPSAQHAFASAQQAFPVSAASIGPVDLPAPVQAIETMLTSNAANNLVNMIIPL